MIYLEIFNEYINKEQVEEYKNKEQVEEYTNKEQFEEYTNKKQFEEHLENLSYNFNESNNITMNSSSIMETHPQAIYTSRVLDLPLYLPEPMNCPNQQEFVSSRIIMPIAQTGKILYIFKYSYCFKFK